MVNLYNKKFVFENFAISVGNFVPWNVFILWYVLSMGPYVLGRFVLGRFVCAPCDSVDTSKPPPPPSSQKENQYIVSPSLQLFFLLRFLERKVIRIL